MDDRPYDGLTPHAVLDALADAGLPGDGRLLQLNSYENRVFQVGLDDGRFIVAKFYRPGRWSDAQIVEEHAFALELAAAEVPAVAPLVIEAQVASVRALGDPPTLALQGGHDAQALLRYAAWPRRAGRAPELDDPDVLTWIGRFLGRWHAIGRRSRFTHRRPIDAQHLGHAPRSWLLEHDAIMPNERVRWSAVSQRALDLVDAAFERAAPLATLRLHGDCHPGNLLWTPEGPHFVDLDDAGMGPAVQDLWMLLSGDDESTRRQLACLLEGYESFMDFDRAELELIEPLRTLRMIHHSAWLAQRWNDPAFPPAFPWFGGSGASAYWAEQIELLRWQVVAMGGGVEEATADR